MGGAATIGSGSVDGVDLPGQPLTMADPAHHPSPKARLLWSLQAGLLTLALVVALLVWGAATGSWTRWYFPVAAAAAAVQATVGMVLVPWWRWEVHRWEVGPDAVYTRTGWLVQERRIAPISRVQTVDTRRGPLERLLGLATVTVTTASAAGPVTIPALDRALADQVVRDLAARAARTTEDAT